MSSTWKKWNCNNAPLDEQKKMREDQIALIQRIFNIKPMVQPILSLTWELFENLSNTSKIYEAEVPIQIMIIIGTNLSAEQK